MARLCGSTLLGLRPKVGIGPTAPAGPSAQAHPSAQPAIKNSTSGRPRRGSLIVSRKKILVLAAPSVPPRISSQVEGEGRDGGALPRSIGAARLNIIVAGGTQGLESGNRLKTQGLEPGRACRPPDDDARPAPSSI